MFVILTLRSGWKRHIEHFTVRSSLPHVCLQFQSDKNTMQETCRYVIFGLLAVKIGGLQENKIDLLFLENAASLFADYEEGISKSLANMQSNFLDKLLKMCNENKNNSLNTFCLHALKFRLTDHVKIPESQNLIEKQRLNAQQNFYLDIAIYNDVKNIVIISENKAQDLVNIQRLLMFHNFRVIACLGEKFHANSCLHDSHPKLFIHMGPTSSYNILNSVYKKNSA